MMRKTRAKIVIGSETSRTKDQRLTGRPAHLQNIEDIIYEEYTPRMKTFRLLEDITHNCI
jgi:hypothetical protein